MLMALVLKLVFSSATLLLTMQCWLQCHIVNQGLSWQLLSYSYMYIDTLTEHL